MKYFQLKYFFAVCKYKTIRKAAEEMYVSQPAISTAIKELENEFDVKLFKRQSNSIVLSAAGEFFLERANKIVQDTEELTKAMKEYSSGTTLIKIGMPQMIGTIMLPNLYHEMLKKYPHLTLEIFEQGSVMCRRIVRDDEADLAFVILDNLAEQGLEQISLFRTELVYCTSKGHRFARHDKATWDMIGTDNVILMKEDSYQHNELKKSFAANNSHPNIFLYSSQLTTIKQFLRNGDCGAFVFADVARQDSDLVALPLETPIEVNVGIVWKKSARNINEILKIVKVAQSSFCQK